MKKFALVLAVATMLGCPAFAGVLYEIEVADHSQSPAAVSTSQISVEGQLLKIDGSAGSHMDGSMIYRGDRRQMVVVNDEDTSYFVIDEEQMRALTAQISEAMTAMEQALAAVPEGQRAQFEQMMKKRMPVQGAPREPAELKKAGDSETINGYPCVRYEVWRGGIRQRELWVTSWENIEGGEDTAQAFQDMSDFLREMLDSLAQFGGQSFGDPAFEHLREMGGIPVRTREFADDGSIETEATLKSAADRSFEPASFDPPKGYTKQDLFKGQKRKKK